MQILKVEAQLTSFRRVKDGSVQLSFRTLGEMAPDSFALVDSYYQQNGWMAFKKDDLSLEDLPDENTDVPGAKSPSQRLRFALLAKHMHKGGTKASFPSYYKKAMEGFIQAVEESYEV